MGGDGSPRSRLLGRLSLDGFGTHAHASLTGYYFAWLIVQPPGFCQDVSRIPRDFEQTETIIKEQKKWIAGSGSEMLMDLRRFFPHSLR